MHDIVTYARVKNISTQSDWCQAEGFHGDLEEFLQWLRRTESQLSAAKPTGGLPETAREQLQQHMVTARPPPPPPSAPPPPPSAPRHHGNPLLICTCHIALHTRWRDGLARDMFKQNSLSQISFIGVMVRTSPLPQFYLLVLDIVWEGKGSAGGAVGVWSRVKVLVYTSHLCLHLFVLKRNT